DPEFDAPGAQIATSLEQGLALAREAAEEMGVDEITVIGGDEVSRAIMPLVGRIYLTEVHASPQADVFLRDFDLRNFTEASREEHDAGPKDDHPLSFVRLERKR